MLRPILILFLAILCLTAQALVVKTESGKIAENIGSQSEGLTTLTIAGSVNIDDIQWIANELNSLTSLDLSNCTIEGNTIADGSFAGSKLQRIIFPEAALRIGTMAFACSQLTDITLPSGSIIGQGAFTGCENLTGVQLNGADISQGYAFKGCKVLSQADITGCTDIGPFSFADCPALETLAFPASVTAIRHAAFAGTGLKTVDLSGCPSIRHIEGWSFTDTSINTLALASAPVLGEGAFFDVSTIGNKLALPAGLTTIEAYALKGLAAVEEITLPSTINYIGDNAMEGMVSLTSVDATALSSVPELGEDVWSGIAQDNVSLNVTEKMSDAFKDANQWQDFDVKISEIGSVALPSAETCRVSGRVIGGILTVRCSAETSIISLELYDLGGRLLDSVQPYNISASMELGHHSTKIFIVRAILDNGNTASLKIAV